MSKRGCLVLLARAEILTIEKNATPKTLKIDFFKNDKKIQTVSYDLYQKDLTGRSGFDKTDVLYLITPDRFANGDPSNDYDPNLKEKPNREERRGRHGGDIQGMIDNLDYISDMGFTAIWINPVLENDMADHSYHGYSTTDYYKVDSRFGTNELVATRIPIKPRHCLLYTSPSPRDLSTSRMPSSA